MPGSSYWAALVGLIGVLAVSKGEAHGVRVENAHQEKPGESQDQITMSKWEMERSNSQGKTGGSKGKIKHSFQSQDKEYQGQR